MPGQSTHQAPCSAPTTQTLRPGAFEFLHCSFRVRVEKSGSPEDAPRSLLSVHTMASAGYQRQPPPTRSQSRASRRKTFTEERTLVERVSPTFSRSLDALSGR